MRTRRARSPAVWPTLRAATRSPATGHGHRLALVVLALCMAIVGCTEDEVLDDEPPPAVRAEPAPAGLRVAVVLAIDDDGTDTADVDELRRSLTRLGEQRAPEVADLRVTVPEERSFTTDVAAVLAGDGTDLVCLLGEVSDRVVVDLADRFPDTRFCAIGTERDELPANVQLISVAQEELGFALGGTAEALADGDRVALLVADDRSDRSRRRAGMIRALGDPPPIVVTMPRTSDGDLDADVLVEELADATEDETVGAHVLDAPPELVAAALEVLPEGTVVAPARDTADRSEVAVRYRIDVAAIVARALDRLVDDRPADLGQVGFAEEAFEVEVAGQPPELQSAFDAVRERLIAGVVDLEGPARQDAEAPPSPDADADDEPEEDRPEQGSSVP